MDFQQIVMQFGKYILLLTDLKIEKKIGTCSRAASGIISPKINLLTTNHCWKENEKVYNVIKL